MKDFVAIDFETANGKRSSICSVGAVVVKNGEIIDSFYSLVKPTPNYYAWFCQEVHGLGYCDTDDADFFPDVWTKLQEKVHTYFPYIEDGEVPFVAHNARFDEGCLRAVFAAYEIAYPCYEFRDTLYASRQHFGNSLENHQLHTVSAACGYDLTNHHHALADAEATGYLGWANYPYEPQTLSNLLDLDVTIISTNPDVATVDNKGVVTILNVGTTTIRATYTPADGEAVSAEYTLTIENGNHYDIKFMGVIDTENYRTTYIEVNENNAADIFGDGKVSFDYDKGILTFSNYRRRLTDAENGVLGWSGWMDYTTHVPLIVEIEGTCSFTNNSAGIGSTGPLIIRGKDDNAKLILEGRFPQLMGSNITISHVDVHLVEETPHPVLTSDTLRVVDNAYLEIYGGREGDMYTWENDGDWVESGGLVAQFNDLQMGEGIGIITPGVIIGSEEDSEIGRREEGMKTFFVGGHEAMHIEIGPQPIVTPPSSGTVSMAALELTDDPKGTEIDGIRYTITTNDSIDVTEGCLVLGSTMTETQMEKVIEMLIPGTAEFADKFHGISFFLPAGEGEIILTAQTFGTHELNIKVGTNAAAAFTQTDKGEVKVQYNCAEPTMVYIYGTQSSSPAANQSPRYVPIRFARAEEDDSDEATGSVKIYAICITGEITALEDIFGARSSTPATKILRDGRILILRGGRAYTPAGVEVK